MAQVQQRENWAIAYNDFSHLETWLVSTIYAEAKHIPQCFMSQKWWRRSFAQFG